MGVDEIRRLSKLAKIVNDHDPLRRQFGGNFAKFGRVHNRPVASTQQTGCEVPHDDFRSATVGEPDVCEQDG
jgi:hypothetical protein